MNRFLKRNLEADLESSQSNINTDEIFGTTGQKKSENSHFAKVQYDRNYITFGFTFTNPVQLCEVCNEKLFNSIGGETGGAGGALAPLLFFQEGTWGSPNLRVYFYNIASA